MKPEEFAAALAEELDALPLRRTAPMKRVRRKYSRRLSGESGVFVWEAARRILETGQHRWIAYELILDHPEAFRSLDRDTLEHLGSGIDSSSSVDSFARTLSGPAWRDGLISSDTIRAWARSPDRWWRRAALVSTVALNVESRGGKGDFDKTLGICEILLEDRDDMVVKALSWALRELIAHDPARVEAFVRAHEDVLAPRVKREVRNKLDTGLKNP